MFDVSHINNFFFGNRPEYRLHSTVLHTLCAWIVRVNGREIDIEREGRKPLQICCLPGPCQNVIIKSFLCTHKHAVRSVSVFVLIFFFHSPASLNICMYVQVHTKVYIILLMVGTHLPFVLCIYCLLTRYIFENLFFHS